MLKKLTRREKKSGQLSIRREVLWISLVEMHVVSHVNI
jgi:hypothetical protein